MKDNFHLLKINDKIIIKVGAYIMEKMKIIEITEEEINMMKSFDYDDELKYNEEIIKEKNIGENDGKPKQ